MENIGYEVKYSLCETVVWIGKNDLNIILTQYICMKNLLKTFKLK